MTPLEAKVKSANMCRDAANKLYKPLAEIFKNHIGKKVCKSDLTLLEKYKKLVEDVLFPNSNELSISRHHSEYNLSWNVRVCCITEKCHSYYDEVTLYIGELKNQILTEICEEPNFSTDFTPQKIIEARNRLKLAKKLVTEAENALYPFGEYDD